MPNPTTTLAALTEQWAARGIPATADAETLLAAAREDTIADSIPFYAKTMMLFGALLGGGLIIISLFGDLLQHLLRTSFGQIFLSALLIGAALLLQRLAKDTEGAKRVLVQQTSLSLMVLGKITLLVFAFDFRSDVITDAWIAVLCFLPVTFLTYRFYPVDLSRMLSVLTVGCLLTFALVFHPPLEVIDSQLWLLILWVGLCGAVSTMLCQRDVRTATQPLLRGMLVTMLIVVTGFGLSFHDFWGSRSVLAMWFGDAALIHNGVMVAMGLVLIGAACRVMGPYIGGYAKLRTPPFSYAIVGMVVLAVVAAPGVLLAGLLLVLGYGLSDKSMISLGVLLVPLSIIQYYYSLNLSLLHKSFLLMATGVLLLAAFGYVRRISTVREA